MFLKVTDQVLAEMVQAIVREVNPEKIILFGSRVRGEVGPDSDLDLMIVEREEFGKSRNRLDELVRIREALSAFEIPKDILVYSVQEVEEWRDSINHIIASTLREGKVLYERP
jgi:predicted nucleotidyltransferase